MKIEKPTLPPSPSNDHPWTARSEPTHKDKFLDSLKSVEALVSEVQFPKAASPPVGEPDLNIIS